LEELIQRPKAYCNFPMLGTATEKDSSLVRIVP